jgi:glycosyltransferase involved in cell wall biosynthesis
MHVTVLMAVYNGAATVREALASILCQTYQDWDLIIVDDGSTDGTLAILESLAATDARVRVLRNGANRGLAASLNVAWSQARGDLLARMDADDFSYPDRLHRQVEFMAAHPEVAVLGTGIELMDSEGRLLGCALCPEWHEELQKRMYKENPFAHPSVMMRRGFLEALGGYDGRLKWAEDADLWLRGYRQFRYHNLQQPLIRYRVRSKIVLRMSAYSAFVLLRASLRERLLLTGGLHALRHLVAGVLVYLGLRSPVQKPNDERS